MYQLNYTTFSIPRLLLGRLVSLNRLIGCLLARRHLNRLNHSVYHRTSNVPNKCPFKPLSHPDRIQMLRVSCVPRHLLPILPKNPTWA